MTTCRQICHPLFQGVDQPRLCRTEGLTFNSLHGLPTTKPDVLCFQGADQPRLCRLRREGRRWLQAMEDCSWSRRRLIRWATQVTAPFRSGCHCLSDPMRCHRLLFYVFHLYALGGSRASSGIIGAGCQCLFHPIYSHAVSAAAGVWPSLTETTHFLAHNHSQSLAFVTLFLSHSLTHSYSLSFTPSHTRLLAHLLTGPGQPAHWAWPGPPASTAQIVPPSHRYSWEGGWNVC